MPAPAPTDLKQKQESNSEAKATGLSFKTATWQSPGCPCWRNWWRTLLAGGSSCHACLAGFCTVFRLQAEQRTSKNFGNRNEAISRVTHFMQDVWHATWKQACVPNGHNLKSVPQHICLAARPPSRTRNDSQELDPDAVAHTFRLWLSAMSPGS